MEAPEINQVKIYSVGVWNLLRMTLFLLCLKLKFTPLEFETRRQILRLNFRRRLKFTPLEFETLQRVVDC